MSNKQLKRAVEGNYYVVFFKNDFGGTSLQSGKINQFLTKNNFNGDVNLSPGAKVRIPFSNDWNTVTDVFISKKIKTVFVAVEYVLEEDVDFLD